MLVMSTIFIPFHWMVACLVLEMSTIYNVYSFPLWQLVDFFYIKCGCHIGHLENLFSTSPELPVVLSLNLVWSIRATRRPYVVQIVLV